MADATMERSLAAAIESSLADTAGTLIWLVPPQYQHDHRFQEHESAAQPFPDYEGYTTGGDVVAFLLDEFSPRDSDLDDRIIDRPTTQQMLLMAMASLQQEFGMQIISQLEGGEAYPNGGLGAVPAPAAAVAELEKQTFHAAGRGDDGPADHQSRCGITCTCSICLEDFEDGDEISVMPCSRGHEFHTNCIAKWSCPLCRHVRATGVDDRSKD